MQQMTVTICVYWMYDFVRAIAVVLGLCVALSSKWAKIVIDREVFVVEMTMMILEGVHRDCCLLVVLVLVAMNDWC